MKEEEKLEKEELISVKDVSKVYRLYDRAIDRLLESVSIRKKSYHKDFFTARESHPEIFSGLHRMHFAFFHRPFTPNV